MGQPEYTPPEKIWPLWDEEGVNFERAGDWYSLGVIMYTFHKISLFKHISYEMLIGKPPFRKTNQDYEYDFWNKLIEMPVTFEENAGIS